MDRTHKTPSASSSSTSRLLSSAAASASLARASALKRDSLAAGLERGEHRSVSSIVRKKTQDGADPHLSTAKRKQQSAAFSKSVVHASLERQIAALQADKGGLEAKVRDKEAVVARLESDRRVLAEKEKEEREECERMRAEREDDKVSGVHSCFLCS